VRWRILAKGDGMNYDKGTIVEILVNTKNVERKFAMTRKKPALYGAVIFEGRFNFMKKVTDHKGPINPNFPCKVMFLNIRNIVCGLRGTEKRSPLEATRKYWEIVEKYRDNNVYEYAVGLIEGISKTAYKINRWYPTEDKQYEGCYEFEAGEEKEELVGFSWHKQIDVNKRYFQKGQFFIVEFDGNGRFRLIKPSTPQWFGC
jgi:hypothetical protein